ncbi:MAG: amidohydrolase family protein [Pirellulales bacterium]|nr:amidohydrolase family protein [Pirellulales bacterium]
MQAPHGVWRLKARYAFPVSRPPIENALVTIAGGRLVEVASATPHVDIPDTLDLGDVALVPGLINAHTHLEFSHFRQPLGQLGQSFPDWIREVVAWRRRGAAPPTERPATTGLRELAATGTTTVGEIATAGWSPDDFAASPVAATVFYELIGLDRARIEPNLAAACDHLARRRVANDVVNWQAGLSPHAPYTVHPQLFARLTTLSAAEQIPLAFHLAESREELELLSTGSGPFRTLLQDLGAWQPGAIARGTRPLDYLRELTRAHRALVIHGNYLTEEEAALLARHADRMALVYCPRTHAYFGHERYPLARRLAAGVAVALGTDSRASNPDLSLWEELRHVAAHHRELSPAQVLELGTLAGAKALGLQADRGTLEAGRRADLAVIALTQATGADPHELLFAEGTRAITTIRAGNVTADESNLLSRISKLP